MLAYHEEERNEGGDLQQRGAERAFAPRLGGGLLDGDALKVFDRLVQVLLDGVVVVVVVVIPRERRRRTVRGAAARDLLQGLWRGEMADAT